MKKMALCIAILFLTSGCSKNNQELLSGELSENSTPFLAVSDISINNNEDNSSTITESASQVSEPNRGTEPISDNGEMILSYDPKNYFKAMFEGNKISVLGTCRSKNHDIDVYFDVENYRNYDNLGHFYTQFDGKSFKAEYDCADITEGDYTVMIEFNKYNDSEIWTYYELPVHKSADEIAPVDVSDIVQSNSGRAEAASILPREVVAKYIVSEKNTEEIKRVLNEITTISNGICEGIDDDYEKLRAISKWVSENICYDLDALGPDGFSSDVLSLDYVLKNKRSLCGGFSNITAALCTAQKIECYNVHGIKLRNTETLESAKSNAPHQCNFAVIDGRRIWVDTLWNSYNIYLNGEYKFGDRAQTKYFDIGGELFAYDYKITFCEYRKYFEII